MRGPSLSRTGALMFSFIIVASYNDYCKSVFYYIRRISFLFQVKKWGYYKVLFFYYFVENIEIVWKNNFELKKIFLKVF